MSVDSLLAQFAEEDRAAEQAALARSAIVAHNVNPDQHVANQTAAKSRGIPVALATPATGPVNGDNLDTLLAGLRTLPSGSPTAKAFTDPEFAKKAHDDHGILHNIATKIGNFGQAVIDKIPGDLETLAVASSAALSVPAMIPAGFVNAIVTGGSKMAGLNTDQALAAGTAAQEEFQQTFDYKPKTVAGADFKENIAWPFKFIAEGAAAGADRIPEGYGGTALKTLYATGVNVVPFLLGAGGKGRVAHGDVTSVLAERGVEPRVANHVADAVVATENARDIHGVVDAAKESKLKGRDPETFTDFARTAVKEDAPSISMPVDKFDDMLASKDLKPEDVLANPEQYHSAKFQDAPVVLSPADLAGIAEHVTPEHIGDMKVGDASSLNEVKAKTDEILKPAEGDKTAPTIDETTKAAPEAAGTEATPSETSSSAAKDSLAATNESRLAVRAEADAIKAKLTEDFGALPEYEKMNMKDQADRAQALLDADYDAAKRMAMGEELPPTGVREATMFEAVKIRAIAEGDITTLKKLVEESKVPGRVSEYAQAIKAADSRLMDDPVKVMQEAAAARAARAAKTGQSPKDAAHIDDLEQKLATASDKLSVYEEAAAAKQAEKVVETITKEIQKRTARKQGRVATKQVLDSEFKDLKKQFASIINPNKLSANPVLDPALYGIIGKMAKNRLESGLKTVAQVVDSIYHEVKDVLPGVTRRELRDAWTRYGETGKMSQEALDIKLRELRRQGRLISALEDAKAGQAPLRSGLKRDPVSDEVRALQKEVKLAMDENGISPKITPEEHYKTSLDGVKTRLRNGIADLKKQIAEGKRAAKSKGIKYDEEALGLKATHDELSKVLDEIDTKPGLTDQQRLKIATDAVERSIAELDRRRAAGDDSPRAASKTPSDPKLDALRKVRDAKKKAWEAEKKVLADRRKAPVPDEDLAAAKAAELNAKAERQAAAAEKAYEKANVELERRIKENDLNPQKQGSSVPQTPKGEALKKIGDGLRETLKQMKEDAKPPKDPEAARLKAYKTRIANDTGKLEGQMKSLDFSKAEKTPVKLDAEGKALKAAHDQAKANRDAAVNASGKITHAEAAKIVDLSKKMSDARVAMEAGGDRLAYGAARVAFENYAAELKGSEAPLKTLIKNRIDEFKTTAKDNPAKAVWEGAKDTMGAIADNSVAMVASLDNSFLGRQGLKTLMTHPSAWYPGAKQSFVDFAQTLGGKNAHDALMADVYSRENYLNGEYQRAKILAKTEEQFPSSLPERVPVIGKVFEASEAAFTGSAMRMRTSLYDLLSAKAKEAGVDMTNKTNAESVGKLINSLTARGEWGERGAPAGVKLVLWAPKMLKANIDVLTAHTFGAGLETAFARKQAAINLLKIVTTTATVMTIANALHPGSAELDPRSSDFGKIKVGDTRFDITGGSGSLITLAARIATRASKNTQSGLVTQYGLGFGQRSPFDALVDFITNKTTPTAGVVASWLKGKGRDGMPFTWSGAAYGAYTPISIQNFISIKDDASADKVAGALVDLIGINANSYGDDGGKRSDLINRLRLGKTLTPAQQGMYDSLNEVEQKHVDADAAMTPMQAAFSRLGNDSIVYAWSKATDAERASLAGIYDERIAKYLNETKLQGEELDKLMKQIQKADDRK